MATPSLDFYGVKTVPSSMAANAFYLVENGNYAEMYVTSETGVPKMVGNTAMISAIIAEELSQWSGSSAQVTFAADIPARDALAVDAESNLMVVVIDATGDPTVQSGSALYAYSLSSDTWHKLSEYESMDISLTWGDIVGKPTATATQIDDAVAKAHQHTNKTQLDKISEDGDGNMTYGGTAVKTQWVDKNW